MDAIGAMLVLSLFFLFLFVGGLWADGKDRRDARKRNRR